MTPQVLVIAEHDGARLAASTLACVGAARAIPDAAITVALLAGDGEVLAREAATIAGVDEVCLLERAENTPCLAAIWAPQIAALGRQHTHLLAPATTFGKDLLPRIAGLLGVSALSDISGIVDAWTFERPIYAGNVIETVAADPGLPLCATIRPTAFAAPAGDGSAVIRKLMPDCTLPRHTRFVSGGESRRSGPELQTAARVVAGGRGLGGPAGFALIERLAATLDAAVGASRAAVDAGWVSNDLQVGQTGKIVAPELYIAVGISGAIQHLTGIKDAGTIVAINQDAEAPLCRLADLVLVADLNEAVPALITALESKTRSAESGMHPL